MNTLGKAAKTIRSAALLLRLLLIPGCNQSQPTVEPQPSAVSHEVPQPTVEGASYDFYLLNLSWSPEFCYTHPDSPECASHPGFVVHGLWPEDNDGNYPEHCPNRPSFTSDAVWRGLMPTASLAQHEWETHGTCTPYDADTYFGLIRKAYKQVQIPREFTGDTQPRMEPPAVILGSFADANPSFPKQSFALSCGNNYLTAIEICFDKNLHPEACPAVRSCRANNVKIAQRK